MNKKIEYAIVGKNVIVCSEDMIRKFVVRNSGDLSLYSIVLRESKKKPHPFVAE